MIPKLKASFVLIFLVAAALPFLNTVTQDAAAAELNIYVGTSSTYQTIQQAINAAPDNAVIHVEPGIYYENLAFSALSGYSSMTIIGNGSVVLDGVTAPCLTLNATYLSTLYLYNMTMTTGAAKMVVTWGAQVYMYGVDCNNLSVDSSSIVHDYKWVRIEVHFMGSTTWVIGADVKWSENGAIRYQTEHYYNGSFMPKTNGNGTVGPWAMKHGDYVYSSSLTLATNEIWIYKAMDGWVETYKVVYANESYTDILYLDKDIIAPPKVGNVTVTAMSQSELNVSWDPSPAEDIFYYFVYTNLSGPWEWVTNVSVNWYLDVGLSPGFTIYYQVAAFDLNGLRSQFSNIAVGTTLAVTSGEVECSVEFENATFYPSVNYSATVKLIDGLGGIISTHVVEGSKNTTTFYDVPLQGNLTVRAELPVELRATQDKRSGWWYFQSDPFALTTSYPSVSMGIFIERYDFIGGDKALIEGIVTYNGGTQDGNLSVDAEVRLLENDTVLLTMWTDNDGYFQFNDVEKDRTYSLDVLPPMAMAAKNGTEGYLVNHVKKFLLSGDLSMNITLGFGALVKNPLVLLMRKPMGTNIPLNAQIQLQFNHPVDLTPLRARFSIAPKVDNLSFDQTNDTTFHISHDLFEPETTYTISIGEALISSTGEGFQTGYTDRTWAFTTGTAIVTRSITIVAPNQGALYEAGRTITVHGTTYGIAPDTQITVELDGEQRTTAVMTDGKWAVDMMLPDAAGSYVVQVSGGGVEESVPITVVDGGSSEDNGLSVFGMIIIVIVLFVIIMIIVLVVRARRKAASGPQPGAQPQAPAPARPKPSAPAAAAPTRPRDAPAAPAKQASPAKPPATSKPAKQQAPAKAPAPAKPAKQQAPAKAAKGEPTPQPTKPPKPAPPPEPEEMPEPPEVPPEISMEEVFEDVPDVAEPEAPEEKMMAEEKMEDVKEEELTGERRPLTPDQQRMYKRAQGLERALNFDRAALMYEDLEMWDDARRCRQAKAKEDSKDIDLNLYKRGRPQTKGDFDEYGQLKTPALFPCPECGSLISSEPCRKCGWKGGKDDITKEMLEKKM